MCEEKYLEECREASNAKKWEEFYGKLNYDCEITQRAKGEIVIKSLFELAKDYGSLACSEDNFKGILGVVELPDCETGTYAPILLEIIKAYFGRIDGFRERWPKCYKKLKLLLNFLIEDLPKSEIKKLVKLWREESVRLTYSDFTQDALLRLFNFVALVCGKL